MAFIDYKVEEDALILKISAAISNPDISVISFPRGATDLAGERAAQATGSALVMVCITGSSIVTPGQFGDGIRLLTAEAIVATRVLRSAFTDDETPSLVLPGAYELGLSIRQAFPDIPVLSNSFGMWQCPRDRLIKQQNGFYYWQLSLESFHLQY